VKRIYLIYCLSGFVSLGYQVAWFRIYIDRFGSTNLTFALVVCNFIAGLGVGALASKRFCRFLGQRLRINDQLRLYGVVELLITGTVTLTLLTGLIPATAWGKFPYHLVDGVYQLNSLYQFSQLGLAILCVFVPCFFMGSTFPLLCDIQRRVKGAGRFPSALYAWNTAGACLGVLACLFIFLPGMGHESMFWMLAVVNLGLGAFLVVTGGATPDDTPLAARPIQAAPVSMLMLTCAVLSGLLSGALEGDMFKRIDFLSTGNSAIMALISFWAILAIFISSWIVRAIPALTLRSIKLAWVAGLVAYAAAWRYEGALRAAFSGMDDAATQQTYLLGFRWGFVNSIGDAVLFVGIFVFPAFLGVSLLLPYVCNRIHDGRRHIGLAYGLNTLAFCAGLVGFTLIAPRVSVFYSMKLMMVVFVVCVVLLLLLNESRRLSPWQPAAAAVALIVAIVWTPAGFDPDYMIEGEPASVYPVRALKSNGAHTTYVVNRPDGDYLYFERHPMSAAVLPAAAYMRLMAHVPLLAHPQPESALLICFGVGMTASAIATHDTIASIDVVELNDKVIETAPEFSAITNAVQQDPRIRFIIDDGRAYLRRTDRQYDLITSEPPPPMQAGVYRLYTHEYYEQVLQHLTEKGLMTQWVPIQQMPADAVALAIRTFIDVFPNSLLFTGGGRELILMGSPSPIDARMIEQRFHVQPEVTADLRRLGIDKPVSLLARFIHADHALRTRYEGGRTLGDAYNDFEFLFDDPDREIVISYAPFELLAELAHQPLNCADDLRGVLTHLGRLRYHVPDYPLTLLVSARQLASQPVSLAQTDWLNVTAIGERLDAALAAGHVDQAQVLLREVLSLADEQPAVWLQLAMLQLQSGDVSGGAASAERFRSIEPNEEVGYRLLGIAAWDRGRRLEAIALLRQAVRVDPHSSNAHHALGGMLVHSDQRDEGIDHLRRALEIDPGRADTARLLESVGLRR
jgi:spermidine synthase